MSSPLDLFMGFFFSVDVVDPTHTILYSPRDLCTYYGTNGNEHV
jgi:hypothetical protein